MTIKQEYLDRHGPYPETAIAAFVTDLMRGDPNEFKQGYTRENAILAAMEVWGWDRRDIEAATANITDNIVRAEQSMGFDADTRINLLDDPKSPPHSPGQREYQRHVAIEWEGGVLWLNMFDFASGDYEGEKKNRHYCIDVRSFNSKGEVKGEGVFTMSRTAPRGIVVTETTDADWELPQGHWWTGGFVVSILTDPDGEETHVDKERE